MPFRMVYNFPCFGLTGNASTLPDNNTQQSEVIDMSQKSDANDVKTAEKQETKVNLTILATFAS